MSTTTLLRGRRGKLGLIDLMVFLVPMLIFIILLYGTLIWIFYVSLANWKTVAPNYTLTGFTWYKFIVAQPKFWVDVRNNLRWLIKLVSNFLTRTSFNLYLGIPQVRIYFF